MLVNAALLSPVPALNPANAAEVRLLALGDSLTSGYGLPAEQGFARQLERALRAKGHDVRVLDAGVAGDTTAGGLSRLEWALGDKPDAAIVALGANDMLRGIDPAESERNLDAILGKLKNGRVKALLAGMRAAPNWGPDYQRQFDAIYPTLAARHGVDLFPFFLDGVAANPELAQPDRLHPNARGVAVMVERILPQVERLVAAARAGG